MSFFYHTHQKQIAAAVEVAKRDCEVGYEDLDDIAVEPSNNHEEILPGHAGLYRDKVVGSHQKWAQSSDLAPAEKYPTR